MVCEQREALWRVLRGVSMLMLGWFWAWSLTGCVSVPTKTPIVDLGEHRLTVYWLVKEREAGREVALYQGKKRISRVSRRFARALRMQGSGRLRDGRLVQYAGACPHASKGCMVIRLIDRRLFPMGVGASGLPLSPLRSVAVDTRRIPLGTRLYIPALQEILRRGGVPHHGCFIADDRGGRITGGRLDLFAGNRGLYARYLEGKMPKYARVFTRHPQCERLPSAPIFAHR